MVQIGRDLDLLVEPLRTKCSGQLCTEDLHGHLPLVLEVLAR
jgi:hypothetical protein